MRLLFGLTLVIAVLAALMLERQRTGLAVSQLQIDGTPVTMWRPVTETGPLPLVVIAHGYAGSRQMMRAFAITLARSGLAVASLDLPGHGRNPRPMTGDVTRLDGATAMLTREVIATTRVLQDRADIGPGLALLGHSMATDIIVRAAEDLAPDAVVAVSMYSEAVTSEAPARLLILSGAWENRLREVALEAVQQIDADASEGMTVMASGVARRAVAAPHVGHVGVLYAPVALMESRDWITEALGSGRKGSPPAIATWTAVLLVAILLMARPMAQLFGPLRTVRPPLPRRTVALALGLPVLPAVGAAALVPDLGGLLAFAPLSVFLAIWGAIQIGVAWSAGARLSRPNAAAVVVFAGWGFGLFALALDRYGGAFLPVGPRVPPTLILLPATMLYLYGDALLTAGARWLLRIVVRAVPLAAMLAAMMLDPLLGVAFTVIPVTVLFWLVYGTAGRWIAVRAGAGSTTPVLGAMLAWALAASTPLIAV